MNLKEYIELNGEREIVDIEALEKCLAKPNPKTIYDIEKGDDYFILNISGDILADVWDDYKSEKAYRSMGLAFLTYEEAEKMKKMLLIEEELIRLGGRREFKVCGFNYYLNFNTISESTVYALTGTYMGNEIYFDTEDQARNAVEQIGEQRLIDEYFKPRMIFEEDQE